MLHIYIYIYIYDISRLRVKSVASSDKQTSRQALHTALLVLDILFIFAVLPGKCVLPLFPSVNCTESDLVSAPALRQIK